MILVGPKPLPRLAPALCLDLDGTVRKSKAGVFINRPEDVELFADAEDIIWSFRDSGFLILGISNQGGVAFGHKTPNGNDEEIAQTLTLFRRNPFHGVKCCYHDARGSVEPYCHRSLLRKPGYGMLALFEREAFDGGFVIDWDESVFVGDRDEDRLCAESAGVRFKWAHEFFSRPIQMEASGA